MTTITIENEEHFTKTNFLNLDELMNYLLKKEGYGVLHSVDENELNQKQKNRIELALKADKSKLSNI